MVCKHKVYGFPRRLCKVRARFIKARIMKRKPRVLLQKVLVQ